MYRWNEKLRAERPNVQSWNGGPPDRARFSVPLDNFVVFKNAAEPKHLPAAPRCLLSEHRFVFWPLLRLLFNSSLNFLARPVRSCCNNRDCGANTTRKKERIHLVAAVSFILLGYCFPGAAEIKDLDWGQQHPHSPWLWMINDLVFCIHRQQVSVAADRYGINTRCGDATRHHSSSLTKLWNRLTGRIACWIFGTIGGLQEKTRA